MLYNEVYIVYSTIYSSIQKYIMLYNEVYIVYSTIYSGIQKYTMLYNEVYIVYSTIYRSINFQWIATKFIVHYFSSEGVYHCRLYHYNLNKV